MKPMHTIVLGARDDLEPNSELMQHAFGLTQTLSVATTPDQVFAQVCGSELPTLILTTLDEDSILLPAGIPHRIIGFTDAMEEASKWLYCAGDVPPNMTYEESLIHQGVRMLCQVAHRRAKAAGWYHDPHTGKPLDRNFGETIALMHSELSEALEAERGGLPDDKLPDRPGQEVEFADAFVRIADTSWYREWDVAGAVIAKMRYNLIRADHKPEARRAAGGKAF